MLVCSSVCNEFADIAASAGKRETISSSEGAALTTPLPQLMEAGKSLTMSWASSTNQLLI